MEVFKTEFERMMRALYESSERESELQRQLRRTKESLVSVALRLQVATKIVEEDEYTITALQNEIAEARKNSLIADKQSTEAAEMISSLRIEMNSLKRKIKAIENDKIKRTGDGSYQSIALKADIEVDSMLNMNNTEESFDKCNNATPFQRWKIEKFLYAPDVPSIIDEKKIDKKIEKNETFENRFENSFKKNNAAMMHTSNENQDTINNEVERLALYTTNELFRDARKNKLNAIENKTTSKRNVILSNLNSTNSNLNSTFDLNVINSLLSTKTPLKNKKEKKNEFFLDDMWGSEKNNKLKNEDYNKGKVSIWFQSQELKRLKTTTFIDQRQQNNSNNEINNNSNNKK